MGKKKLSIDGQIDYMKNKSGIQFNIISEERAKDFLANNTYYFKIKSYRKLQFQVELPSKIVL